MHGLLNLDLLALGISVAAAGILGFIVFYNNLKSVTSLHFLLFCLSVICWSIVNYASYKPYDPHVSLWVVRLVLFSSIWLVTALFSLLYVFPSEDKHLPKVLKFTLLCSAIVVSALTLTPYVFSSITSFTDTGIPSTIKTGWGIVIYAGYSLLVVILGLGNFIKKIRRSASQEQVKFRPLIYGLSATFVLLLTFNLVFPAFLKESQFVPFGPIFILPFLTGAAYSIIKHHLLNIKVISTQILIFFLAVTAVVEVIIAESPYIIAFRIFIFILTLSVGILLMGSVMREVKQRAELELLSKELSEANIQLKQLDQARADFITLTSHQLRTPPATIKWYLAAIKSGDYGKLDPEILAAITKTEITNNALISLIDDLLNASRIERGKMEFLFDPVNLDALAKFTVEQLFPQAQMKGLELVYQAPSQPIPEVMADKEKIRQVINNFIDNAIKYTQKGKIVASVTSNNTHVTVSVSDSGKGIDKEIIPSLFQKYTRGKDTVTHATGIGIGLYVAYIVVQNHKGEIGATSDGVGKGATFYFRLPIKNDLPHTKIMDLVVEQNK